MKKIMFNDRYGLTEAVLEGRKTMTRRIIPEDETKGDLVPISFWNGKWCGSHGKPLKPQPYSVGEVVAVAQSYNQICREIPGGLLAEVPFIEIVKKAHNSLDFEAIPGVHNKMFVKAVLMPHQIRITNIRVERLQDISDEDCLREGVFLGQFHTYSYVGRPRCPFNTPRDAFASLIDKVSGKGTWASNPWVFIYEFELVK